MDIEDVFPAYIISELTYRFKERKTLDISDGAADLDDHYIIVIADRFYGPLDLVRNMRNDLYGLPKVVPASFLCDHIVVNLSGCKVVGL